MTSAGDITIVTGPPGAGKSTVARVLTSDAARPAVHLHTDSFYAWIRTGFVLPYLPEAAQQNEVVMRVIVEAAGAYASGGYDVVLDGIIGPWALEPFRELKPCYVILRPTLEIALARATAREGRQLTDVEPIRGLYGAFEQLGELERGVIDSSDQTPEQTAAAIRSGRDGFVFPG